MINISYNYKIIDDYVELYFKDNKNNEYVSYLDLEDLDTLLNYPYKFIPRKDYSGYYLAATVYTGLVNGKPTYHVGKLHRVIMNVTDGRKTHVDHINHNTLDNRKRNLRIISASNNLKHRNSKNKNNKSGYRNVFWSTKDERWLVVLQIEGKSKCFGRFKKDQVDKAGALAEEMREKYYGEYKGNN